jgi:hypothetical protein
VSYGTAIQTQPSYVCSSIDGIHWTTIFTNFAYINNAAYGNNTWVFTASATNGYALLTASVTSSNWSWSEVPIIEMPANLSYLNQTFVMQLNYDYEELILSSPDGLSWQFMSTSPSYPSGDGTIYFGNGAYMLSANDSIWTSSDLITWSTNVTYSDLDETTIGYFGNRFVDALSTFAATNMNGNSYLTLQAIILSSTNGIEWQTNGILTGPKTPSYDSQYPIQFLVLGQGTLIASTRYDVYQSGAFATNSIPQPSTLNISTYAGMTINGEVGAVYQIQCSTNMSTWQSLTNLVLPYNPCIWVDTSTTVSGQRFYRSVQVQ